MSATALEVVTLVFPDPRVNPDAAQEFKRLNSSISFDLNIPQGLTTLSTNGASSGADVSGLVYVPTLEDNDPCVNASAPFIPANATRVGDLPSDGYNMVAIAPWISPGCTLNYLATAQADQVEGLVFFLPEGGPAAPPSTNDAIWSLGDGGRWKGENEYPVYAISSTSAAMIVQMSALYSGNLLSVPFGPDLSTQFDTRDYVRLFMDINTGGGGGLPSLWVFLLIILAILLSIVGVVSLTMHIVQRRRREALRHRVASGIVNLEALGVKRLTVPQSVLDSLPTYKYVATKSPQGDSVIEKENIGMSANPATVQPNGTGARAFDQPSCAICLDDFEPGESTVRELPCRHIFHPECVDVFLRDNSSLCPLCKASALPKGYCPTTITNVMVRRERYLRTVANDGNGGRAQTRAQRLRSRLPGRGMPSTDVSPTSVEMMPVADTSVTSEPPLGGHSTGAPPASTPARREWARRRALAMLGPHADTELEAQQARPRWRKYLGGIFPSLA